jgi:hypothetical protein
MFSLRKNGEFGCLASAVGDGAIPSAEDGMSYWLLSILAGTISSILAVLIGPLIQEKVNAVLRHRVTPVPVVRLPPAKPRIPLRIIFAGLVGIIVGGLIFWKVQAMLNQRAGVVPAPPSTVHRGSFSVGRPHPTKPLPVVGPSSVSGQIPSPLIGPEVGPPLKRSINSKLSDDFTTDHSLNESMWALLPTLAHAPAFKSDLHLVPADLAFTSSGMIMSGVNGLYQYTGIQSRGSFAPPFILEATVRATMSHGNSFELRLVNADGSQGIVLNAHLEPANDDYLGVWLGHTTDGRRLGDVPRTLITREASLGAWCTIRYAIDGNGVGTVGMDDFRGTRLANQGGLHVGPGPFFLVLAQWEGWPHSPGKNEAVWGHVELSGPGKASAAVAGATPPAPGAHPSSAGAPSAVRANPLQSTGVWLGFSNPSGPKDREAELRQNCGDFSRVYVPLELGNGFIELCRQEDKTCDRVCDWEGRMMPCTALPRSGGRDATRVALCR